jgi:RimJ/RimL family protein N-acetyltransferase
MGQAVSVQLRPVAESEIALLDAWERDPQAQGIYNNFGLVPATSNMRGFTETGLLGEHQGVLMVVLSSGEPIGSLSYHQVVYGPNSGSRAYNFGISIIPEYRGKGYGTEAQRLLADYLFATYPVMRVEAQTDTTNIVEQHALEKAGFTREGVLRKAQWRAGDWHDLVVYSKVRGE